MNVIPALRAVAPRADAAAWAAALAAPMAQFGIDTVQRAAAFLGQCAVESGGFLALTENMNYSATRIVQVWPSRFNTVASALRCAHNPVELANTVYAMRMGNGSHASGDGFLFRARGLLQTTGRDAYTALADAADMTLEAVVPWMETRAGASFSACWDWAQMDCSPLADAWDITKLSIRINGGTTALAARVTTCDAARSALQAAMPISDADTLMAAELAALTETPT